MGGDVQTPRTTPPPKFKNIAVGRRWSSINLGLFPRTLKPAKHGIAWEAEGPSTSGQLVERRQANGMGEASRARDISDANVLRCIPGMSEEGRLQMQVDQPATPTTTPIPTHHRTMCEGEGAGGGGFMCGVSLI